MAYLASQFDLHRFRFASFACLAFPRFCCSVCPGAPGGDRSPSRATRPMAWVPLARWPQGPMQLLSVKSDRAPRSSNDSWPGPRATRLIRIWLASSDRPYLGNGVRSSKALSVFPRARGMCSSPPTRIRTMKISFASLLSFALLCPGYLVTRAPQGNM